ncbi:MAG: DUF1295 domain-containing protein [Woeseiaceae bacterium]|nr:DUF1295 domain-containing protein [Woeseiaceae bacterium]
MTSIELLGVLLVIALVVGLVGFARTVWFISIGYAASIVAFVLALVLLAGSRLTPLGIAQLLAALVWGVRLGSFLVRRESRATYRAAVKDQTDRSQALPLNAKLGIWISVAVLYVCMFSPAVFLTYAMPTLSQGQMLSSAVGVGIMWLGLAIEAIADHQKSRLKATDPDAFARNGLYAWVRYPNYLGEILFWFGNFVAGIVAYTEWWHWVMASTGIVCIVLIMMGSTKRMEYKQDRRYGDDSDYQEYSRTVPVLVPWIPLYTLKNIQVYLE